MADAAALSDVLDRAQAGDETAVLQLARQVTKLLEGWGAYTVQKDWRVLSAEAVEAAIEGWGSARSQTQPSAYLESLLRNRFWGQILDQMAKNNMRAAELLFTTIRRLLARWDGSGKMEAAWDDIVQDATRQLWERWAEGEVDRPWSLLCTIAKRRYLDQVRKVRPNEDPEVLDQTSDVESGPQLGDFFAGQALEVLEPEERDVIVRMDIEGQTRIEIAEELGVSEGQVLSIRRAGLRRVWRWAGSQLPPELKEVWDAMFKGAQRPSPEQIAKQLKIPEGEVVERIARARDLLGLAA